MLELSSNDPWGAESALRSSGKFGTVIREGKSLRIFTGKKEKTIKEISSVMRGIKIHKFNISVKEPTLENCFVEIISGGKNS